ncbi:hypothetical protein L7F22_010279 [Adiantum nelumboides]|nr:hypothetical protein [Adiantum nelumboides]
MFATMRLNTLALSMVVQPWQYQIINAMGKMPELTTGLIGWVKQTLGQVEASLKDVWTREMSRIWPEKIARMRSAIEQRMEDVVNSPEAVAEFMDEWLQEEPVRGQESQDQEGSGGLGPGSGLWQGWWAGPCEQITGWTESYTCLCQDNPVSLRHWKGWEPWESKVLREGCIKSLDQEQSDIAGQEGNSLKEVWIKEEQLKFFVDCESYKIQEKSTTRIANEKFDESVLDVVAKTVQQDKEDIQVGKAKEEGLDVLREALCAKRKVLAALETELEKERNAIAIIATKTMAMISRLQEEKSAMQLVVAQLQRTAEEKAEYDEHAMALLKEILFKQEAEKHALEKNLIMDTLGALVLATKPPTDDILLRPLVGQKEPLVSLIEEYGHIQEALELANLMQRHGMKVSIRQLGPRMIQQMQHGCPDCKGSGETISEKDKCTQCKGEKVLHDKKMLEVHVEKGMQHNQKIRILGEADEAPDTVTGDIVCVLQLKEHAKFKRKGDDLFEEHTLNLKEAPYGFQFVIVHLDGRKLLIKPAPGEIVKPEFGSLSTDQCKALEAILPLKPSSEMTNMELGECDKTILQNVNLEKEMKRKQQHQQSQKVQEDQQEAKTSRRTRKSPGGVLRKNGIGPQDQQQNGILGQDEDNSKNVWTKPANKHLGGEPDMNARRYVMSFQFWLGRSFNLDNLLSLNVTSYNALMEAFCKVMKWLRQYTTKVRKTQEGSRSGQEGPRSGWEKTKAKKGQDQARKGQGKGSSRTYQECHVYNQVQIQFSLFSKERAKGNQDGILIGRAKHAEQITRSTEGRELKKREVQREGSVEPQDQDQSDISGQDADGSEEVWTKQGQPEFSNFCQNTTQCVSSRKERRMLEVKTIELTSLSQDQESVSLDSRNGHV